MVNLDPSHPLQCQAKIMDWGMSLCTTNQLLTKQPELGEEQLDVHQLRDLPRVGTPPWWSPEMIVHPELRPKPQHCSKAADVRCNSHTRTALRWHSQVYALGLVVLESVLVRRPNASIRQKLDPEYQVVEPCDADQLRGFGLDAKSIMRAFCWLPDERCDASVLHQVCCTKCVSPTTPEILKV